MIEILHLLGYLVLIFTHLALIILISRMLLDWLSVLLPQVEIPPLLAVLVNVIYKLSNPPLEYLRKYLPPLRLGEISLDMGFIVLFVLILIVRRIANFLIGM